MVGLVTCKNEEDPSKNEGTIVVTKFLPSMSMGIFPYAQGHLRPWSDPAEQVLNTSIFIYCSSIDLK